MRMMLDAHVAAPAQLIAYVEDPTQTAAVIEK